MPTKRQRRGRSEGSVYRRNDGKWVAAVTVAVGSGDRKRRVKYATTKNEALRKLAQLQKDFLSGVKVDIEKLTVEDFLRRWLEEAAKPNLKESSYDLYKTITERFILPNFGAHPLSKVTPLSVQALYTTLIQQEVSNRYRIQIQMVLHTAFNQAVDWGLLPFNPTDRVKVQKPETQEVQALTPEETKRFLEVAKDDRLYALYVLAVLTGARQGELLALQWDDVNWDAGTIFICRSLANVRGRLTVGETKTKSSRRRVDLPRFALDALKDHKGRMEAEGFDSPFVFVNKKGNLIQKANLHTWSFKPLLRKAKLPDIPFHALRHTSCTLLLLLGVHPKVVAERHGHASARITIDRYSHILPTMQKDAVDKLDLLFPPSDKEKANGKEHSEGRTGEADGHPIQ